VKENKITPHLNKRFATYAQWIWDRRQDGLFLGEWVLTDQNPDQTLPKDRLTLAEAKSLLLYLEESKLMFPFVTPEGTTYSVNHVKEPEWREVIKDLKHPIWRRSKLQQKLRSSVLWTILLILSAILGALINDVSKDFYKSRIGPRLFPVTSSNVNQ